MIKKVPLVWFLTWAVDREISKISQIHRKKGGGN
jgi:hypothetical protein